VCLCSRAHAHSRLVSACVHSIPPVFFRPLTPGLYQTSPVCLSTHPCILGCAKAAADKLPTAASVSTRFRRFVALQAVNVQGSRGERGAAGVNLVLRTVEFAWFSARAVVQVVVY
jgi:hypothetical protein